jgi:hypothetical protein
VVFGYLFVAAVSLNRRFTKACEEFMWHFVGEWNPCLSLEDMMGRSTKILVARIREFEESEKNFGKMTEVTLKKRRDLSEVHAFFFKLDLCDESWEPYFDLAHQGETQE